MHTFANEELDSLVEHNLNTETGNLDRGLLLSNLLIARQLTRIADAMERAEQRTW